jgi:2-octaprenyl-6-methoxyphenol hydroxylase
MKRETVDILICGGGLAGLVAAAVFGHAGHMVLLVDPAKPAMDGTARNGDLRSTAFLRPAQALLEEIGRWSTLARHAVPLQALRIVDTTGEPPCVCAERVFRPDDLGSGPLGWNFLNATVRLELLRHLGKQPNVELRFGTGFRTMMTRTTGAVVTLTGGSQVSAQLVIGADGRNSAVRDAIGIGSKIIRYGQKSLAFTATHVHAHECISTEIYNQGGPFTMVPLADLDGKPASAIVWMNAGRKTVDLARLDAQAFNAEMTRRSANLYGPMELASDRAIWPIISQRATRLVAQRTALIAEAAHVLPPIGAQGLNTSLNDVAALLQAAQAWPDAMGGPDMLDTYERARRRDIASRMWAIDLFNRVTRSGNPGLQSLRLAGLKAVHDIAPLRHRLMRAGMGPA